MKGAILAVITDLMFESRLREQARAAGYDVAVVDSAEALRRGVAGGTALVVVDLHAAGIDWREAAAAAKERGVPVLAFGPHTEAGLLRSAREAGCDRVVPRSVFVAELARLIEELAAART